MQQDLYEAVVNLIGQYAGDNIHTSAPAKVGNVDDNFHAELTPNLKVTTDDGREIQYPKVSDTVILMPTGAGGTIGSGTDLKWDLSNATLLPGLSSSAGEQVKRAGDEDAAVMFAPTATITVKKDNIELKKQDTIVTMTDDSILIQRGGSEIKVTSSDVKITTSAVNVSGNVKVEGNIQIQGNVDISGTLTLGGITMNTHTHVGVHGPTGGPV